MFKIQKYKGEKLGSELSIGQWHYHCIHEHYLVDIGM